jgi:hypothetical protein
MRAAGPATGTSLAIVEFRHDARHVVCPSLGLFYRYRPADPLVACERGETVPQLQYPPIRRQCATEILRDIVDDAGGDKNGTLRHCNLLDWIIPRIRPRKPLDDGRLVQATAPTRRRRVTSVPSGSL